MPRTKTNIIPTNIQQLNQILDRNHQVLRNDIAQFKDDILTEIVKLREDVTVVTGYKDQLENHEERIEGIENHLDLTTT